MVTVQTYTSPDSSGSGGAVDITGKLFYQEDQMLYITAKDMEEYQKLKAQVQLLLQNLTVIFPDGNTFEMVTDPCKYASNALSTLNKSLKDVLYGKCGINLVKKVKEDEKMTETTIEDVYEFMKEKLESKTNMGIIKFGNHNHHPTIYEDCEDIEWHGCDNYELFYFTQHGKKCRLHLEHGTYDYILVTE